MPAKDHPFWKILSNIIVLAVLLYMTSSDFDKTEIITLVMFLAGNGLVEKLTKSEST